MPRHLKIIHNISGKSIMNAPLASSSKFLGVKKWQLELLSLGDISDLFYAIITLASFFRYFLFIFKAETLLKLKTAF
jgi:hypothetical protein